MVRMCPRMLFALLGGLGAFARAARGLVRGGRAPLGAEVDGDVEALHEGGHHSVGVGKGRRWQSPSSGVSGDSRSRSFSPPKGMCVTWRGT